MGADIGFDGAIGFRAGVRLDELERDLARLRREVRSTVNRVESDGQRMEKMFSGAAKAAGAFFSIQQGSQLLNAIVKVRSEFQKYEAVLTNTLGSQKAAADAMNLISSIAASTPFGISELTQSYVKLVNQGMNPTRDMIISLGDLAASQGKSFDQLTEAIIDAQTGEFERLKEFGIRASKEGDKVTFTFKEQATTVDFAAASIRDYIVSLGEMEGVAGGMEAISKTIGGQISNLEDAIESMFNKIGEANEGIISDAIASAAWMVEHYEELGKILLTLVVAYGAYRTAVILATAATNGWTLAQTLAYNGLLLVERAQKLLTATMLANPYVAIATGLTALTTALILFSGGATEAEQAQKRLNSAMDDQQQKLAVTKGKVNDLVKAIKDENLTNDVRASKLNELKRLSDGRLNQLTLEAFKTNEATKAIKEYVAALDAESKMKAYQSVKEDNYREIARIESEEAARARQFAKDNFDTPWYKQLFRFRGYRDMQAIANSGADNEEKKARELQNKEIDDMIKTSLEAQGKRDGAQKIVEVKDKAHYENLKKAAQERLDKLSEVAAKGKEGRAIIAEIQGYDKILESYSVSAANKASSAAQKDALAAEKKNQQELKQLNQSREQLMKQTNDKLEDLRIDRLEGFEKDAALVEREYQQMVDEYKELGILNDATRKVLDFWKLGKLANAKNEIDKKTKSDTEDKTKQRVEEELRMYQDLMQQAGTYQYKLETLEKEKNARLAALERDKTNLTEDEYKRREAIINGAYTAAVKEIDIFGQQIFNKLGNNIETASKESLDATIKELENIVQSGKFANNVDVPPQVLLNLKNTLEQIKGIRSEIDNLELSASRLGKVATSMQAVGVNLSQIGDALKGVTGDGGAGDVISGMGRALFSLGDAYLKINKAVKSATAIVNAGKDVVKNLLESNDLWGAILAIINIVVEIIGGAQKSKEQLAELQRSVAAQNVDIYLSEFKITEQMREQNMLQAESIELTKKQLEERKKVAEDNKRQIEQETLLLLERINKGEQVSDRYVKDKTWFLGKSKQVTEYAPLGAFSYDQVLSTVGEYSNLNSEQKRLFSDYVKQLQQSDTDNRISFAELEKVIKNIDLNGINGYGMGGLFGLVDVFKQLDQEGKSLQMTYKELEKVYLSGLMEGETKALFEQLQALKQQGIDVDKILEDIAIRRKEIDTGTTSSAIADSIVDGFRNGKRSAQDFANDFESMMRNAMLSGMRYDKEFEARTKEWYDKFAQYAADGVVDATEKGILQKDYADLVNDQERKRKLLEQASGVSLTDPKGGSTGKGTMTSAVQSITQEQAGLLVGQFNGMRIAQLETNKILTNGFYTFNNIADRSLNTLAKIEVNTANTVYELKTLNTKIKSAENAARAAGY